MKYSINIATDTITFALADGETVEIPRSDPVWDEIIEMIFGGFATEDGITRCIEDFLRRQEGS